VIIRDPKRAFSTPQKYEILEQQDKRCANCHKKLDLTIVHFHHMKSWSEYISHFYHHIVGQRRHRLKLIAKMFAN